jgi:hypothetical protein
LERGPELGGQFRLAGRQPSRGQITDLIAWFGRRLNTLGVDVRLSEEGNAVTVAGFGADEVIVATGSRPPRTGFQRVLPLVDRLPGVDDPDVFSIQAVLDGAALPGRRVVVLDDVQDWRGIGTAVFLAEASHDVTIVTAAAVVAGGLYHSAADGPLRKRFAEADGRSVTSACVIEWRDGAATVRSTLTGEITTLEADALVIAETPVSETGLASELTGLGIAFHQIGDAVAPRRASLAFFEARELARRL